MLEAVRLSKHFGDVVAVDDLDLSVRPGDVFCLLGANGAGKTTTINLFLNFIDPTSGHATVSGLNVVQHPLESKQKLAYIPEQVMLYRTLSGLENLRFFSRLSGSTEDDVELQRHLDEVGLPAAASSRRVSEYSKGMRQKVAVAIAMAKRAESLLLDEPTSGLDPKAADDFSRLLVQLREREVAILMATHDLFRAKNSGTRVGIMKHGRLVETLDTNEIGHADLERLYLSHMRD